MTSQRFDRPEASEGWRQRIIIERHAAIKHYVVECAQPPRPTPKPHTPGSSRPSSSRSTAEKKRAVAALEATLVEEAEGNRQLLDSLAEIRRALVLITTPKTVGILKGNVTK